VTTSDQKKLFSPLKVGSITLKHRIVMPAMSRLRAHWPSATPSELMLEYYRQRASDGGLQITEAAAVSSAARAYHTGPGLYTEEHVTAWKAITDAIHEKGGVIFVQLSHAGRATSDAITGVQPIAASVVPSFWVDKSIVVSTPQGFTLPAPHRAVTVSEIHQIVEQFRAAAERAQRAGFDGVEVLAANGHLVEQFLQNHSNLRKDEYGGSVENRERFLLEILESIGTVWPSQRIGVRISPSSVFSGMGDDDPRSLFRHLAERLNDSNLAYLHIIEPRIRGADTVAADQPPIAARDLGQLFRGPVIAAGGFSPETAEIAVQTGVASLVSFGRHFSSNPDLPRRIERGLPLRPYDRSAFYAFDARGYTDFKPYEPGKP
jgi:N-ethylmaleimide reductase